MNTQERLNELSRLIELAERKQKFVKILCLPVFVKDMRFINHLNLYDNKVVR